MSQNRCARTGFQAKSVEGASCVFYFILFISSFLREGNYKLVDSHKMCKKKTDTQLHTILSIKLEYKLSVLV